MLNLREKKLEKEPDPMVKEVPNQIKKLVSDGSKEAIAPGNGTCLIGAPSIHLQGDIDQTIQISRDLNTFIGTYRGWFMDKIEANFPITLTIGVNGETKFFDKG